jgi:UDP-glucose 4-epimerase
VARYLVTGGAGFIGSHLARSLLDDGHEVDVADNLMTGDAANVPDGAELLRVDVGEPAAVAAIEPRGYDAVLHMAGQSSGEKSFEDPVLDLHANARSTLLLARWASEHGVPALLHASSMGVYGQPESLPVAEDAEAEPISFYGTSKYVAEQILRVESERSGLRAVSFRMFSVYGPGQNLADLKQGMASIYLAYILRGEPVLVTGSLERTRDLVYVDDVVAAWRAALDRPVSGAFNLGSGVGTTVSDLVWRLIAACGLPAGHPIEVTEGTPGDQFAMVADISRAHSELGWEPRVTLKEGLEALVGWARGRT